MLALPALNAAAQPALPKKLALTFFLEGLYNTTTRNMNQTHDYIGGIAVVKFADSTADTVTVELHDAVTYATVVYTVYGVNLYQNGTATVTIPKIYAGSYYITVKTRNHIETTTASPVAFTNDILAYNFSSAASQAFGNNQKLLATGVYGFFAGDITQDGLITIVDDRSLVQNKALTAGKGYVVEDISGDGFVTVVDDRSLIQTNALASVHKKDPLHP